MDDGWWDGSQRSNNICIYKNEIGVIHHPSWSEKRREDSSRIPQKRSFFLLLLVWHQSICERPQREGEQQQQQQQKHPGRYAYERKEITRTENLEPCSTSPANLKMCAMSNSPPNGILFRARARTHTHAPHAPYPHISGKFLRHRKRRWGNLFAILLFFPPSAADLSG